MNRENAKALLPIIQAWADGKEIEVLAEMGWVRLVDEALFCGKPENYRIKQDLPDQLWKIYIQGRQDAGQRINHSEMPAPVRVGFEALAKAIKDGAIQL